MTFLGQSLHWARLIPRSELWPSAVGGASVDPQAIKHLAGLPKLIQSCCILVIKPAGFLANPHASPTTLGELRAGSMRSVCVDASVWPGTGLCRARRCAAVPSANGSRGTGFAGVNRSIPLTQAGHSGRTTRGAGLSDQDHGVRSIRRARGRQGRGCACHPQSQEARQVGRQHQGGGHSSLAIRTLDDEAAEIENLSKDDPRYRKADRIVDVLSGQEPDPTAGATHFLNPTIVRKRRGGSLPPWAKGDGQAMAGIRSIRPMEAGRCRWKPCSWPTRRRAPRRQPRMRDISPRAPLDGTCRRDAVTASPALPADNTVQIVAR